MQKLSIQNKKLIVTEEMLKTFPEPSRYDMRTALIKWWINSRAKGGLRLTSIGYKLLGKMQYKSHEFNVKKITTSRNLITLDKNLECPYYIDGLGIESKICIFGDEEAMTIILFNDFHSFLRTFH